MRTYCRVKIIIVSVVLMSLHGEFLRARETRAQPSNPEVTDPPASTERPQAAPSLLAANGRRVSLAEIQLPWNEPAGRGPSIGYNFGLWGGENGLAVHLRFPLGLTHPGHHWGLDVRGILLTENYHDFALNKIESRRSYGLRVGLFGQSEVFLNLFRVFGGGGAIYVEHGKGPSAPNWVGTGGFGIEFFIWRAVSYYMQIEGRSRILAQEDNFITFVAGVQLYPFSI